ncbi:MAG TPA: Ppx/GppA phosphatase family protein [Brevundimonas sp.]|jgi:exopolyphosphatase/guanosine-5'-triphosphate,3'-diphosphate pyrophosphatase|uniref:Ppx/GppA phosphatase family protein n=1 Tax=Brevundimonas sp. TaxID=1871086 RepID=UPI002DE4378C|nr:Ppx/GppA phosphatase family protein [Brevundimonas sp.]
MTDPIEAGPAQAAVVDVGSNSVRMVLYRLEGRAVWTVFNEKVLAGLGRDLPRTGRLSERGVDDAMAALKRFAAVIEGVRPDLAFVAATAAVREAEDGPEFCERVAAETGLRIRVLTGEEEARASALGVLAGAPDAAGTTADMGGTSLELTRIGEGKVMGGVTLPLGPFALSDGKPFDAERVRALVAKRLKPARSAHGDRRLHAVGGAWRSLAQLHMAISDYPLKVVHQYAMSAGDAREVARFAARQSRASLEKSPGISRRRAETLPYAALVLEGLIDQLGFEEISFSAWGVREGLLFEALGDKTLATDPLLAGTAALGARQGVSPGLPGAVAGWIDAVTRSLPPAFDVARDAVLVRAACNLCDIGARLHPDHRVELAFDQVLRASIPGQTHVERAFLATAVSARYGGPTATPEPATIDRLLNEDLRGRARALGLAIRLACDLSGRSPQLLANATAAIGDGVLRLSATPTYADMLLGEQTRRRARALAEALDAELVIEGGG